MTVSSRLLVAAVIALGALLGWAPAVAAETSPLATRTGSVTAADEQAVFLGTFVRRPTAIVENGVIVRRYQVAVERVYGPTDITTKRVTVRTRPPLEQCPVRRANGQTPGQTQGGAQQEQAAPTTAPTSAPTTAPTTSPTTPAAEVDKRPRFFTATVVGNEYVVAGCTAVMLANAATVTTFETKYGEGRQPGSAETPSTPLDDVGLLCPDTQDAVSLEDEGSCSALDAGSSFDRNAAPGLALVIVGGLGLLVVRRLGRPRRG